MGSRGQALVQWPNLGLTLALAIQIYLKVDLVWLHHLALAAELQPKLDPGKLRFTEVYIPKRE